ncbi:uncharacterized protein LOC126821265 [Patella vulgata]|uniref:uncharacterized protein LOC126821265 n=1 Tax=Patella vulgata TaxID=6465 RepID=UPI0021801418|nr:uncharacterized protein LOC126821265 [Patella vulgata]
MLIILKKGNKTEKVENVYLSEGHKPTVDGKIPLMDDEQNPLYIESALWFKTYMVSVIYIDCDKRKVIWFRDDVDPFQGGENLHDWSSVDIDVVNGQYLFQDASMVYDFDPTIDELTDRSVEVMNALANRQITKTSFISEVIRIIHCYILPAVCFTSQDMEKLKVASQRVESILKITEGNIIKKGTSVDLSCNSLDKQRKRLLRIEDFHLESYVRCCNRIFLSFLLLHIEKDILNLDSSLFIRQQEINKRRDSKADTGDVIESELKLLRIERDESHKALEKLQVVRENIKNVIKRQNHSKITRKRFKITQNVFHDIYRELSIRLQEQKEEMHKLVIQKIKITAVREAIKNSLKELNRDGLSPSQPRTSYTDGSEYSTNMLGTDEKPADWMTIDDRVKKLLSSLECEPLRTHSDGIHLILEKTEAALSEMSQFGLRIEIGDDLQGRSRLSSIGIETEFNSLNSMGDNLDANISASEADCDFLRNMGEASRTRRSQVKSLSVSMCEQLSELSTSSIKPAISDIVQDFLNHIDKMCRLFFNYFPNVEQRHFNKLWISYEAIFCERVIKKLMELYFSVYKGPCHTLYRSLVKLSISEFVIDDQFFQMVMRQSFESLSEFEESAMSSTEAKLDFQDSNSDMMSLTSSEIHFEISKCTSEQLYNSTDQECGQNLSEVHNILDPACCFKTSPSIDSLTSLTEDTIGQEIGVSGRPEYHTSKSVEQCYKEAIEKLLSPAKDMIIKAIEGKSILEKLRHVTKAFAFMNNQLSRINSGQNSVCCDDMITITTALILDLDCDMFTNLYSTINLLIDLKPPFLSGSVHDFCLTTFFGAYQYLFDKQVLERRELTSTNC